MTCQTFTHTRAVQSKNHIKKYVKQAAMLSVSLVAFCSYGSCGDDSDLQAMEGGALNPLHHTNDFTCVRRDAYTSLNNLPLSNENTPPGSLDVFGVATENIEDKFRLTGFCVGTVQSVSVVLYDLNSGLVNVVVGGQSFQGIVPLGVVGTVQLTSVNDLADTMTFDVTSIGLATTEDIQSELKALFKLDIGAPIFMRSASTDLTSVITNIKTNAITMLGIYGLSYGYYERAGMVTYKLSKGSIVWEQPYFANSVIGSRTIPFDNGLTITTAANNDETKPLLGVEFISVESGNQRIRGA